MLQFAYASQRETELVEYFNFTLTNPTEDLNNFSSEMKLSNSCLHLKATYHCCTPGKLLPEKVSTGFNQIHFGI